MDCVKENIAKKGFNTEIIADRGKWKNGICSRDQK